MYLPKFHSELNPIELVWSVAKKYYRDYNSRAKTSMVSRIKNALTAANREIMFTQRCFRKVRDFIWAYSTWRYNPIIFVI